jgi:hypothetical protein
MSIIHKVTDDQVRQIWSAGFDSASSILKDALTDLLEHAYYNPDQLSYLIPSEQLGMVKDMLASGYFTQMRVGTKSGLDYYMAMSNPAENLIPKTPARQAS